MKRTVFIQDSSRENLEIFEMILAKRGIHVVGTSNEQIGKTTLDQVSPDVILLNFKYLSEIHKKSRPSEIETWAKELQKPVLVIVDESDVEAIKSEDFSHVSDLIVRPFAPVNLVEKVLKSLESPLSSSTDAVKRLIAKSSKKETSQKPVLEKKEKATPAKPKKVKAVKEGPSKPKVETSGLKEQLKKVLRDEIKPLSQPEQKQETKQEVKQEIKPKKHIPEKPQAITEKEEEITEVTDAKSLKSWLVQNISVIVEENWAKLAKSKKEERRELLSASIERMWDHIPLKKIEVSSQRLETTDGLWPTVSGNLEIFPASEVVSLIGKQALTGMLRVQKKAVTVLLFFKEGDMIFAIGKNLEDELKIGRFLVEEKAFTKASLEELLKEKEKNPNIPFGYFLFTEGYLRDKKTLQRSIARQTKSILFELLTWKTGQFNLSLRSELPSMATSAGVCLKVKEALEEGSKRRDEWEFLRAEIGSPSSIYCRRPNTENLVPLNMSEIENRIYKEVNGLNKISDIVEVVFGHPMDVYRTLHRFNRAGLIEKR